MSTLDRVLALASPSGYRLSEVSGLLANLRQHLDPELWERVRREAPGMSNAELDQVLGLLRQHAEVVAGYTRREGGKVERVRGYTKLSVPELVLVANQDLKHPMHVKTPAGAKWYDQPIGSLIYAKPHPHKLAQHEKLVYKGTTPYAVPASAPVYVAAGIDQSQAGAVAGAQKLVKLGPDGKWGLISAEGVKEENLGPGWEPGGGWKLLSGKPKVPVLVNGKLAAWVPQDWKVYTNKSGASKAAKDPGGDWWEIDPGEGLIKSGVSDEGWHNWVTQGLLYPDPATPYAPAKPAAEPGAEPGKAATKVMWEVPKADVGGVAATAKEIQSASDILMTTKSTAVKQPLAAKGHPLAAMDYHAINKAVLKEHPELKVPPGTKAKHVGQVKVSVLYHLGEQHSKLLALEAEAHAAAQAQQKALDQAAHAQHIAGQHVTIGGVSATKGQVQQAITALEATGSTAIKQTLKAKGSPLAESDYWAVVHAHQQAHPETAKDKAKPVFVAALKEALGVAGTPEPEEDNAAKQLHDLIESTKIPVKEWNLHMVAGFADVHAALAGALIMAHNDGKPYFVAKGLPDTNKFHVYSGVPQKAEFYWEVTPEDKLIAHSPSATVTIDSDKALLSVKQGLEVFKEPPPAKEEPAKPAPPKPEPKFSEQPGWAALDKLVTEGHDSTTQEDVTGHSGAIAFLLKTSAEQNSTWYFKMKAGKVLDMSQAGWQLGAPGHPVLYTVFRVMPDHSVTMWSEEGAATSYTVAQVTHNAEQWLKLKAPEPLIDIAGKQLTATQIKAAIAELAGTNSTWVLNILKAADHPLVQGKSPWPDYTAWQQDHPIPVGSSVKSGFILWLGSFLGHGPPEPGPVAVHVAGKLIGHAPAGSKVYVNAGHMADAEIAQKYIKLPDGHWWSAGTVSFGKGWPPHAEAAFNQEVASGSLVQVYPPLPGDPEPAKPEPAKPEPAKPEPAKPEPAKPEPAKPEGAPIKVLNVGGTALAGEVPAGSKVYKLKGPEQSYGYRYAKLPDGTWMTITNTSVYDSGAYQSEKNDQGLAAGKLEEVPPPAPELLAELEDKAAFRELLKHGTVDPDAKPEASEPGAFGYALAQALKGHKYSYNDQFYVWQSPASGWTWDTYNPGQGVTDFYVLEKKPLTVRHLVAHQGPVELPWEQVKTAAEKWITPDAVTLGSKAYKHGHYYKGKGTAHLEIKKGAGSYAHKWKYSEEGSGQATYLWHKSDGDVEEKTPTYAGKYLAQASEYHEVPKQQAASKTVQQKYSTVFQPGKAYGDWEPGADTPKGTVTSFPDGSATFVTPSEDGSSSLEPSQVEAMLGQGILTDSYQTSVVKPGVQPSAYRVFGLEFSKDKLQQALSEFETGPKNLNMAAVLGLKSGSLPMETAKEWAADHGLTTGYGQRAGITALLRELLLVPQNKQAKPSTVSFLKGLPPGIGGPKDAFTFDGQGYAKPFTWSDTSGVNVFNPWGENSTYRTAKIKEISQQFGGGKLIGTHPAALKADEKAQWLDAFKQGDMVTVFSLDAKGGKVSPAHPGAPKNTDTHQIAWAPWGQGEVPASKAVEGAWSDHTKVTLPKAELDNYIILAGLQHAEYLSPAEKRSWVTWHRKHAQDQVDVLSRAAFDRFAAQANTLTDPPVWTKDIKPAKSYDVHVEEKTPASSWPSNASTDFVNDHKAELQPFVELQSWYKPGLAWNSSSDLGVGPAPYSARATVIQAWLDDLAAKELAEKLKPKYHVLEDKEHWSKISDQFGWHGYWRTGPQWLKDQELTVAKLARLWGMRTPETRVAVLGSTAGVAHQILEPTGTLAEAEFAKLTSREVSDLAREHVFDWAIDNPRSSPASLLRLGDGSVVGTDKSGAFGDFGGWDGLDLDGMNAQAEQAYSRLYRAVMHHEVSHAVADQAFKDSMLHALRISRMSDARYRELLEEGFAYRPAPPDVDQIIARKNSLPDDFLGLWGKVYAQAGWSLPELPAERLRFGIHSGFSEPSFFDHVIASKSYGASAFFASPDLDDSSFLVWTELSGKGKSAPRLVRGESAVHGDTLAKLTQWAQANETHGPKNMEVQAAPPGVKGQGSYYKNVIKAAKAVSRHAADQMWDGPITKGELQQMNADKVKLATLLQLAEDALGKGPDSQEFASLKDVHGHPVLVQSMAKYYLGQIAQIEEAKEKHNKFQPGDLPAWSPPPLPEEPKPKPVAKPKVKVERKTAVRELGSLSDSDGELHLNGSTFSYPGEAWHITLPTGEVIEFQDFHLTSTKAAHTGRIRFKADATKGSTSLERIRAQLEEMGLPLAEAEDQDLELYYWRHLGRVLADRMDWGQGKHAQVWSTLKAYFNSHKLEWTSAGQAGMLKNVVTLSHAKLPPDEELALWRGAWAHLSSPEQVQGFADKGGYLPHFKHWDIRMPDAPNGKPVWYRFNAQDQAKFLAAKRLSHSFHGGYETALPVARSGGLLSTEGRLRVLGRWISGTSSTIDMEQHGSSGVLYLRTNYSVGSGHEVMVHPRAFAQSSTYGFGTDAYGDINKRKTQSAFDPQWTASLVGNSTNETLVKDGASLLDDIELLAAGEHRQKLITELKGHGITHIRGLPVEDRIVKNLSDQAYQMVSARTKDATASWFDHPEAVWVPPPSGVVTHAAIETEAETAAGDKSPGALAKHLSGVAASTVPAGAAKESAISHLFYGTPHKPAKATIESKGMDSAAKKTAAKRVSDTMTSDAASVTAMLSDPSLGLKNKWGDTDVEKLASALIKEWASSNSTPLMVALHEEAEQLFGLQHPKVKQLDGAFTFDYAAAQQIMDKYGPVLRDFLAATWNLTQADMVSSDVEKITLHRIMKWSGTASGAMSWAKGLKAGDKISAPAQRPIASWGYIAGSAGVKGAGIFGQGDHYVLVRATFPRQAALTYPKSGFGSLNEVEFTMLNVPGEWEVVETA